MPTYIYQCKKCLEISEVVKKMLDPHPTKCEKCNKNNSLEQVLHAVPWVGASKGLTGYPK